MSLNMEKNLSLTLIHLYKMNREQCEKLIERLVDNKHEGQIVWRKDSNKIVIGDVLEKLHDHEQCLVSTGNFVSTEDIVIQEDYLVRKPFRKLLYLYARCGISLSLQEIIEESGWEVEDTKPREKDEKGKSILHQELCLKDPNARALFEYLITLFL